ncbi:hypothetical protein ACUIAC_01095 [Dermabacteraceae bacterium P13138]
MMLTRVEGRLKLPHGEDGVLFDGDGLVDFRLATPGTHDGALRAPGTVTTTITAGVIEPVELSPGNWRVEVRPNAARCWKFPLAIPDGTETINLADDAPITEIDGKLVARGPAVTNGKIVDGALVLTVGDSDITPIPIPGLPKPGDFITTTHTQDGTWTIARATGDRVSVSTDNAGTWVIDG